MLIGSWFTFWLLDQWHYNYVQRLVLNRYLIYWIRFVAKCLNLIADPSFMISVTISGLVAKKYAQISYRIVQY